MKKISRMIIFSLIALYLTTLWNQGFIIEASPWVFVKAALLSAVVYYMVRPLTKLVLLPLNILTMGMVGVAVYCLLFYLSASFFSLVSVTGWTFQGIDITQTANIFVSALSVSTIINLLEHVL
ncbi:MAG: phage holin family protein [Patescibacteria group bacterium]